MLFVKNAVIKIKNIMQNFFGTCLCCGNVIDDKAKFKYEMNKRLLLYRKDKRQERKFTLYNK